MGFGPVSFLSAAATVRTVGSAVGRVLGSGSPRVVITNIKAATLEPFGGIKGLLSRVAGIGASSRERVRPAFFEEQAAPGFFGNVRIEDLIRGPVGAVPVPAPEVEEVARADFVLPEDTPRELLEPIFVPAIGEGGPEDVQSLPVPPATPASGPAFDDPLLVLPFLFGGSQTGEPEMTGFGFDIGNILTEGIRQAPGIISALRTETAPFPGQGQFNQLGLVQGTDISLSGSGLNISNILKLASQACGRRITRRDVIMAVKHCGIDVASQSMCMPVRHVCQIVARGMPRRRRGISAADMRRTRSTIRKVNTIRKSLKTLAR